MAEKTWVIQFVPGVREGDSNAANVVRDQLQKVIDDAESKGYAFDNIHTVYILSQPGCLNALMGAKATQFPLTYLSFKKKIDA